MFKIISINKYAELISEVNFYKNKDQYWKYVLCVLMVDLDTKIPGVYHDFFRDLSEVVLKYSDAFDYSFPQRTFGELFSKKTSPLYVLKKDYPSLLPKILELNLNSAFQLLRDISKFCHACSENEQEWIRMSQINKENAILDIESLIEQTNDNIKLISQNNLMANNLKNGSFVGIEQMEPVEKTTYKDVYSKLSDSQKKQLENFRHEIKPTTFFVRVIVDAFLIFKRKK